MSKNRCPKCGDEMVLCLKFERPEKLHEALIPLDEEKIEDALSLKRRIYHCRSCGYDAEAFAVQHTKIMVKPLSTEHLQIQDYEIGEGAIERLIRGRLSNRQKMLELETAIEIVEKTYLVGRQARGNAKIETRLIHEIALIEVLDAARAHGRLLDGSWKSERSGEDDGSGKEV